MAPKTVNATDTYPRSDPNLSSFRIKDAATVHVKVNRRDVIMLPNTYL